MSSSCTDHIDALFSPSYEVFSFRPEVWSRRAFDMCCLCKYNSLDYRIDRLTKFQVFGLGQAIAYLLPQSRALGTNLDRISERELTAGLKVTK